MFSSIYNYSHLFEKAKMTNVKLTTLIIVCNFITEYMSLISSFQHSSLK